MTDQHRQVLLDSSASYVEAKMDFANAIVAAQRVGLGGDEIARVTTVSIP